MGIVIILLPILLWWFARSGKINAWSPLRGRLIGLLLLALVLYFEAFWGALAIEGWQFRIRFDTDNGLYQPVVDVVSPLLSFGKKTGWLFVIMTAFVCFWRIRQVPSTNQWLIQAAAWISTFTLIGSLLELFPLNPLLIYFLFINFPEDLSQEQWALIALLQISIWLVLLASLTIVLLRTRTKSSSQ